MSLGREAFGIKPARPLRVLVIQAEDDRGDLNEMAVGVTEGLKLTNREIALCKERCHFVFENSRTGMEFINYTVAPLLEQGQYDLVIINPLQAYLGGDVKDVEKTVLFLRNGLNPLLTKFGVGLILVHHTPKIIFRGDTTEWRASDWMYAGAGAADITNWTRAAVVIDPTMNPQSLQIHRRQARRTHRVGQRVYWRARAGPLLRPRRQWKHLLARRQRRRSAKRKRCAAWGKRHLPVGSGRRLDLEGRPNLEGRRAQPSHRET